MGGFLSYGLTPLLDALSKTTNYLTSSIAPGTVGGLSSSGEIKLRTGASWPTAQEVVSDNFYSKRNEEFMRNYSVMENFKRQMDRYDIAPGGALDALARELQILHERLDTLTRRLQRIEGGFRNPYDQMAANLYNIGPIKDPNAIPEVPGTPKKEEPHPAQNSSFVLKI